MSAITDLDTNGCNMILKWYTLYRLHRWPAVPTDCRLLCLHVRHAPAQKRLWAERIGPVCSCSAEFERASLSRQNHCLFGLDSEVNKNKHSHLSPQSCSFTNSRGSASSSVCRHSLKAFLEQTGGIRDCMKIMKGEGQNRGNLMYLIFCWKESGQNVLYMLCIWGTEIFGKWNVSILAIVNCTAY